MTFAPWVTYLLIALTILLIFACIGYKNARDSAVERASSSQRDADRAAERQRRSEEAEAIANDHRNRYATQVAEQSRRFQSISGALDLYEQTRQTRLNPTKKLSPKARKAANDGNDLAFAELKRVIDLKTAV